LYLKKEIRKIIKEFYKWKENKLVNTNECNTCSYRYRCVTDNFDNVGNHE